MTVNQRIREIKNKWPGLGFGTPGHDSGYFAMDLCVNAMEMEGCQASGQQKLKINRHRRQSSQLPGPAGRLAARKQKLQNQNCLLYTSDAADAS